MLASLYNIPTDEETFNRFSFANVDQHRKIISAIRTLYGKSLTEFILDPVPPSDLPAWAYRHQQMHNAQNAVLGIAGNDLTTVDYTRPDEMEDWVQIHAQEHYKAAAQLGIG